MTVEMANEKTMQEFESKLKDKNFKAVAHTLRISVIQFIPMEEFNKKTIISENYNVELKNYISEKSINLIDFFENRKKELEEKGLFVEHMFQKTKDYSQLDILKTAFLDGSSSDFSSVLELLGITPPPNNNKSETSK